MLDEVAKDRAGRSRRVADRQPAMHGRALAGAHRRCAAGRVACVN